ncbi:MAG: radical SAM protein [Clostridiales bacterium]
MDYKPLAAVWEITMGCNMRCKHCGSSCKNALPDELSTEDALKICDELGSLGLKWVTISGGEALTRDDWHLIAKKLKENGVTPLLITNGMLVDDDVIKKASNAGIESFSMSLDGLKETHDFMRMPGSFDKIMSVYDNLEGTNLIKSAITTINQKNINELEEIKKILLDKSVKLWQLQIGLPMGNFEKNSDLVLYPEQIDQVINFAFDSLSDERITIYLADCLGYYNRKEIKVRDNTFKSQNTIWQGCNAGKRSFGILHNGDILGCTSIRDKKYIEGNLLKRSLKEIWEDKKAFSWNRDINKTDLKGFCSKCGYGDLCLGGCPNTRLTFNKDIYSSNNYCSYYIAIKKAKEKIMLENNIKKLEIIGKRLLDNNEFQLAELVFEKLITEYPENIDFLNHYGFISYNLKNYFNAQKVNEKVIEVQKNNIYANKGLGLTYVKLGEIDKGIDYLRKSVEYTDSSYMYPYYDLALTLIDNSRIEEAQILINEGLSKTKSFKPMADELLNYIESAP